VLLDSSCKLPCFVRILGKFGCLNASTELLLGNLKSERILVLHQIGNLLEIVALSAITSKIASCSLLLAV
jgi:hypothetical protein